MNNPLTGFSIEISIRCSDSPMTVVQELWTVPKSPVIRHAAIWHPFPFLSVYSTNSKQTSETHFVRPPIQMGFLPRLDKWRLSLFFFSRSTCVLLATQPSGNVARRPLLRKCRLLINRLGNLLHGENGRIRDLRADSSHCCQMDW